jgi:hypothetical protein
MAGNYPPELEATVAELLARYVNPQQPQQGVSPGMPSMPQQGMQSPQPMDYGMPPSDFRGADLPQRGIGMPPPDFRGVDMPMRGFQGIPLDPRKQRRR